MAVACMAVLFVWLGTARAAPPDDESAPVSAWRLAFLGGVVTPLGDMVETHQEGLAASLRLGWTPLQLGRANRFGLGLELATEYSPLPRQSTVGLERIETHFLTVGLMPRLILGPASSVRLWLGGGGGMAYERTQHMSEVVPPNARYEDPNSTYAPVAMGAAGLELHFLSGGGLGVVGSYMRTYGDLAYETLTVTGGLVLAF